MLLSELVHIRRFSIGHFPCKLDVLYRKVFVLVGHHTDEVGTIPNMFKHCVGNFPKVRLRKQRQIALDTSGSIVEASCDSHAFVLEQFGPLLWVLQEWPKIACEANAGFVLVLV
ncbi:hypothetical protein D3C86_1577260 [compost metagenome]